ncbi:L-ribulose-5-phosphate 4-epimerase [Mycoplasmopsis cynos]|uniref:L-ribulose-5-phosphate 4-epimerase n=1 Tax=Mycoplasmopsis cynos TaxID=171284 RepID=A0A449AHY7_9BACT|nr:L-ribulose-5-phosphate 4-epimerase [Mycoplasmopsis cynos]TQC54765.1 L-ribulose-5-phosphate 4-epimerase [Mycoplasmopsis cynos]WQQ13373.1 L-ribulose-5-phosphate 4-epimerase [Mycoplasmopsis cynos]WQQ13649.1 L-ribulose-5-phosphate 4-epimerase [Mycoplasmopsis cynos]VEU64566.1 L-ribulose-5-phosphate 4-epimerase [Mycoplasmopsis cynos]
MSNERELMVNNSEILKLKKEVYEANMLLYKYRLAIHTWGNVSGITNDRKYMIIKPSGVSYEALTPDHMVVVDLENNVIDSQYKPSSDTPTHTLLYKANKNIKGIVHTHSPFAVSFAQAGKEIPCLGTTHADNFFGSVPCTRELSDAEINGEYEHNTGLVIIEHFNNNNISFESTTATLVKEHGPFVWSIKNPIDAVNLALTLEEIAKMALYTKILNPDKKEANRTLQNKHHSRKHGPNAYYGQDK